MQPAYTGTLLMRLSAHRTATLKTAPGNLTQVRHTNTMLLHIPGIKDFEVCVARLRHDGASVPSCT